MCHYAFEYVHPFYDATEGRGDSCCIAAEQASERAHRDIAQPRHSRRKGQYYKAFDDAQFPLNCSDVSLFCYRMVKFIITAQKNIISDLGNKWGSLKAAYDKLNDYAEQKRLSGDQKDILFYLLQIELFYNNPQPASRKELCSFLEAGNTRLMSSINALLGLGLLQEHGKRPIRYSLSETAHRQFLQ